MLSVNYIPFMLVLFVLEIYFAGLWTYLVFDPRKESTKWQRVSLATLSGISTFYFIFLFSNYKFIFTHVCLIVIGAVSTLLIIIKKKLFKEKITDVSMPKWNWYFILILLPIVAASVLVPISEWDSRSIWFFHGKMLYYSKGIFVEKIWTNEFLGFSHPHYPKLFPSLLGSFTSFMGIWNEFLPKVLISFFIFLVGTLCLSLNLSWKLSAVVILAALGIPQAYTWNGYMDAYVSSFCFLGLLFLCKYFHTKKDIYLYLSISSLGIILNLKNEGLALCFGTFLCAIAFNFKKLLLEARTALKSLIFLAPAFVGFIGWQAKKNNLHIVNYFHFDQSMSTAIFNRLSSLDELLFVLQKVLVKSALGILFMIISLYLLSDINEKKISLLRHWLVVLWLYYFIVIVVIYLGTPFELKWHLDRSLTRVTFVLNAILVAWVIDQFFIKKIPT